MQVRFSWNRFAFAGLALSLSGVAQAEVKVTGFSDVGYQANQTKVSGGDRPTKDSSFYTGDLDLFLQSNLEQNFSWLSETAFSTGPDNFTGIDVERLQVTFKPKDYFNLSVGRFHTALGYWNDNFHHGAWLAASIQRPAIYKFEDDSGLLPIHSIGIEVRGLVARKFGYILNLANGRGTTPSPPQIASDANASKAINGLVYWNTPLAGLRIGAGYYSDAIPALTTPVPNTNASSQGPTGYSPHNGAKEGIFNAHLVYKGHNLEFINELHQISHTYDASHVVKAQDGIKTQITAYYSQLGYQIKDVWTPYVRYEQLAGDKKNDEVYLSDLAGNPLAKELKHSIATAGLRFDVTDVVAWKLEVAQDTLTNFYAAADSREPAAPVLNAGVKQTVNSVRTNFSFAF